MSEQQFHVVALSPLRSAFFDPVSRINLSRTNPQGLIPVGSPISGSIKAGLLSGGLIDKSMTILPDLLKARAEAAKQKQAGFPRPATASTAPVEAAPAEVVTEVTTPLASTPVETPASTETVTEVKAPEEAPKTAPKTSKTRK